jgi:hypothetical protein
MPRSDESELAVIGSMLLNVDAVTQASEILNKDDFYNKHYGIMFETLVKMCNEGEEIDEVTFQNRLKSKDLPPNVTTIENIANIMNATPTSVKVKNYAQIVKNKSLLRQMITFAQNLENDCYAGKDSVDYLLEVAEKNVFNLIKNKRVDDFEDIQFSNCIIDRSNRGLSIQVRDAGCVRNVSFDHISVRTRRFAESWWGCAEPIAITAVDRSSDNPGGTIENVRFSYIDCEGENGAVIYGLPGRVRDISLDHVRIALNETSRWPKGQYDLRPGEGMQIVAHPAVPLLTHEVEDLRLEQVRLVGTDGKEKQPETF